MRNIYLNLIRRILECLEMLRLEGFIKCNNGELYQKVHNEISKKNILSRVRLFRHVSDEKLRILYDAADLFVLTSVGEAFGMTLLEAMASGVPVIASNSGACPEVIGNAGILFNQGNYTELAKKILFLSHEKELSRKLREAVLKRVRETFSWEDKIDQYLKLYKITCQ